MTEYVEAYMARLEGLAYTAPIHDEVAETLQPAGHALEYD